MSLIGIDKQGRWHASQPSNFLSNADDPVRIVLRQSGQGLALVPGGRSDPLRTAADAGLCRSAVLPGGRQAFATFSCIFVYTRGGAG
ncbi:hypothetical protein [Chromobacterium sp. CV08]|uniref:hypothetical protein n=1 Tax=Chromobacterium sp. CV08 TaxID=3133274 RepID=UPI003DA9A5CD